MIRIFCFIAFFWRFVMLFLCWLCRMEVERNEMYKTLVVDYELALERKVSSHSEEIKVRIMFINVWLMSKSTQSLRPVSFDVHCWLIWFGRILFVLRSRERIRKLIHWRQLYINFVKALFTRLLKILLARLPTMRPELVAKRETRYTMFLKFGISRMNSSPAFTSRFVYDCSIVVNFRWKIYLSLNHLNAE